MITCFTYLISNFNFYSIQLNRINYLKLNGNVFLIQNKILGKFFGELEIEISIDEVANRPKTIFRDLINKDIYQYPTFYDKEDISGKVTLRLQQEKSLEHLVIKIELIGSIGMIKIK